MKCGYCKKENNNRANSKFCSDSCKNKYWHKNNPKRDRKTSLIKCLLCGKEVYAEYRNQYCSRKCSWASPIKNKKISQAKMNELNPMWRGDNIGMTALHRWVEGKLKKPTFCQDCGIAPAYDLANKCIYSRDLTQWEWLCRRCHMKKDGRLDKFIRMAKRIDKKI